MSRRAFVGATIATVAGLSLDRLSHGTTVARAAPNASEDVLEPAARAAGELSELITPTASFYVVTKNAGGDPRIDAASWRLIVDGQVNTPVQLDYATLLQVPPVEVVKTLECISNLTAQCELASFGCGLISTAVWTGARLGDIFDLAAGGLKGDAVSVVASSADEFSSAIPREAAIDPETLLVYQMNGAPLPAAHGFPARLLVPGRYGMKSAKWVRQLTAMNQQIADWYGQRGWNRQGIVKTMARIDTPAPGAELESGSYELAGIAYAGLRGIAAVEYSADAGATWQQAVLLEPQPGRDSWVRWSGTFSLSSGQTARLVCRAVDGTGTRQPQQFSLPEPDGGSGWHAIEVRGV